MPELILTVSIMKIKGLRWWIITLIGLATVINYIDRSAINIMWPYIYKDFGIADADNKNALALLTTFFMVAYAIGQTVTGKMMDAIGTRLGMAVSIAAWSVSIALHAIARTISSFSIFRFFLGMSEAGNWPGATKSNAEWFPAKERAIAQGIFGAGASLGSVVSAPVIAALYLAIGWQGTFAGIAQPRNTLNSWLAPIPKAAPNSRVPSLAGKQCVKNELHGAEDSLLMAQSV